MTEAILVELTREPIEAERVRRFVLAEPTHGGVVTFEGVTRQDVDAAHGPIQYLEYEAYESMTVRQLDRLAREAQRRHPPARVAIVHRLGRVPCGEVSVMIAVAAAHRAESFDACRWLIDTLKQDVPIWKKEVFADGFSRWVEGGTAGGTEQVAEDSGIPGKRTEP